MSLGNISLLLEYWLLESNKIKEAPKREPLFINMLLKTYFPPRNSPLLYISKLQTCGTNKILL